MGAIRELHEQIMLRGESTIRRSERVPQRQVEVPQMEFHKNEGDSLIMPPPDGYGILFFLRADDS